MPYQIEGMGWIPDPPSQQDYCVESPQVNHLMSSFPGLAGMEGMGTGAPKSKDLSEYCNFITDQLNIGQCTGEGGTGYVEFLLKKKHGIDIKLSPRFLYKVTRYMMGELYEYNDTGAFIRTMLGALANYGVCPEDKWPTIKKDDIKNQWNDNPHPLAVPMAYNYRIKEHVRLDSPGVLGTELLNRIRATIAVDENPVVFGFTCFPSLMEQRTKDTGEVPFRYREGAPIGGHCVLIVGYDDDYSIGNSTGAFKFKNSWSRNWGQKGFGWIPYDYPLTGNAADFWSVLDTNFLPRAPYSM
jgi:C1A family cysteine protease